MFEFVVLRVRGRHTAFALTELVRSHSGVFGSEITLRAHWVGLAVTSDKCLRLKRTSGLIILFRGRRDRFLAGQKARAITGLSVVLCIVILEFVRFD